MIPVDEARARILAGIEPLGAETVSLPQTLGRVLAEDLAARVSHPPMAVSAMDGYAARAEDLASAPVTLPVVGESAAGHPFAGSLQPGQALRIFTGAAVPPGADVVVMQEDTEAAEGRVTIKVSPPSGKFVRAAGLDFRTGEVLLRAGTLMGPRQIGLAASMNIPWASVRRRPRVAILSTGDEIAMPGEPLGPAQIISSNGPALAAFVAVQGGEAIQLGIARDNRASLAQMVEAARGCDLLVTSGGAAVGEYDLVQEVLGEAGLQLDFWKIAMRPGKPLIFGRMGRVPVLGLPGNPVSSMVCAYVFLAPLLRAMRGLPPLPPTLPALLDGELPANDAREEYMRASLTRLDDGTLLATPFGRQDSAVTSVMANADALLIRPANSPALGIGAPVRVMPLEPGQ